MGEWFDERPIGGHVCTVGFYQMLNVHPVTYLKFLFFSLQKGSDAGVMARKFVPSNMMDKLHDTEKIKKKKKCIQCKHELHRVIPNPGAKTVAMLTGD